MSQVYTTIRFYVGQQIISQAKVKLGVKKNYSEGFFFLFWDKTVWLTEKNEFLFTET